MSIVTSFAILLVMGSWLQQAGGPPDDSTGIRSTPSANESPVSDNSQQVLLQFRDQEWLAALQWLAEKLELNLDWKELPEDKLSLASSQEISLEETEDLFNMQLLARGFVLLKRDGVLRLVSLKDIDITLVPRVEPEALADMPKHSVARVSFPLEWMIADEAAKELKPLLSPYGKLSPMASSNRLEVVDAVVNLREFHKMLQASEQDDARRERVAEFHLQHRRAEEIAPKVRQLLGLPPENSVAPSTQTQLDIEQARFRVEAVKQMGREAQDLVADKKATVFLVVNEKENSLLVNAPPNKIEIVRQAVKAMDKPLANQDTTWETINRVKVYDVAGFEPDAISKLVASLQERGSIARDTRIQYEAAHNRMIAFASPTDQVTIAQLIESFRAEKRTATVLPLSNVDPVYAAKAVQLILKTVEKGGTPTVASTGDGKFQVEPDTQHNRLLLWANPTELREVREFLARLGETFSEQSVDSRLHVIDIRGQDPSEIIEKLKQIWPEISDSPLLLDVGTQPGAETGTARPEEKQSIAPLKQNVAPEDSNARDDRKRADVRFVANVQEKLLQPSTSSPTSSNPGSASVRLMKNSNGDLVVLSRDPIAAETAKRLIEQLKKEESEFRVLTLKHAQAAIVKKQLDMMLQLSPSNASTKLSSAPPVIIDIDARTNRIIVQNANEKQWKTIEDSVEILDLPNPEDEKLTRERATYRFQHRKASIVAEALKGVYQDLLTFSDRTLASSANRTSTFNKNLAASASNPEYQGLMSISVDSQANLIIISAPKYLLEEVLKLVESMDTPTDGNAIAIIPSYELPYAGDIKDTKAPDSLRKILQRK